MKRKKSLTKLFVGMCCSALVMSGAMFAIPQTKAEVYAATVSGTTITNFGTYNSTAMSWDIIGYVQANGSVGSTTTNTALILSHNIIAEMRFDVDMATRPWSNSSIRTWLNETFLDSFTTAEKTAILKATMQDASSATSYTANESGDYCFFLSYADVYTNNLLGSNDNDRIKKCSGENTLWWLRTPGYDYGVKYVTLDGSSTEDCCDINGGVVPAMFVDLTKLISNQETASANSYEDYWLLNDTITLPTSNFTGLKFLGSGVAKQTSIIVEDGIMKYSDGKKSVNVYNSNADTKWVENSTKQLFFDPPVVEGSPLYTWLSANATRYHHYITSSGGTDYCTNTYTSITSSTTSLTAGWYVVDSDVTISSRIACTGAVNLILLNGKTLTASAGITVSGSGNSLTIYGQKGNTGKLVATGSMESAGIGGYFDEKTNSYKDKNSGKITINGGTVTATGSTCAAGIGGVYEGSGSDITINGGTVTATGGTGGAGIGGGFDGSGSNITINGGTVTATGGGGAGIGGGGGSYGSNITINGGTVTATGGQAVEDGIGNGQQCTDSSNIFIGDAVVVKAGTSANPTTEVAHANVTTDVASYFSGKQYVSAHETFQIEYYDVSGEGKSMPTDDKYYEIGDDVTISKTTPTRTGYTFLGWATSSDGELITSETIKMVDGGVTLYAKWEQNSSGGGSTPGAGVYFNSTAWLIPASIALVAGVVGIALVVRRNSKN